MWRFIFAKRTGKTWQMKQQAIVRVLALKDVKAKKIELDLPSVDDNDAFQISAVKKWRFVSCKREQSSEMANDREGLPILIRHI
jgi:hypothetical protein